MPSYYKTKCSFSYNIIFLFKRKKCLSGLYALIKNFTFANETEDEKYTKNLMKAAIAKNFSDEISFSAFF